MLGYVIGDDDDDGNDWDYNDEDWDDVAGDVDNIADDMDELTEGFEDFREDAGERADELAEQREQGADQLQQSRDERADQLEAAAQNREKNKAELRDKQQKHQAKQVQDQLRQRKGLPRPAAIGPRVSRSRRWAAAARSGRDRAGVGETARRCAWTGGANARHRGPAGAPTSPGRSRSRHAQPDSGQGRGGKAGAQAPGYAGGCGEPQERDNRT